MTAVLVVDEAPMIRKVVDFMLTNEGITVYESSSGATALKRLEQHPNTELVIANVGLPDLDGKALLEKLRSSEKTSKLPVIMLSSLDDVDAERELKILGAKAILKKPIVRDVLVAAVKNTLGLAHAEKNNTTTENTGGDLSRFVRQMMCAGESTSIADIYKLMVERGFKHVPVANRHGEAIGLVSDRDILKVGTFTDNSVRLPKLTAKDVMTTKPLIVSPTTPLAYVATLMLSNRVDSVLIAENGKLKGIITGTDFLMLSAK